MTEPANCLLDRDFVVERFLLAVVPPVRLPGVGTMSAVRPPRGSVSALSSSDMVQKTGHVPVDQGSSASFAASASRRGNGLMSVVLTFSASTPWPPPVRPRPRATSSRGATAMTYTSATHLRYSSSRVDWRTARHGRRGVLRMSRSNSAMIDYRCPAARPACAYNRSPRPPTKRPRGCRRRPCCEVAFMVAQAAARGSLVVAGFDRCLCQAGWAPARCPCSTERARSHCCSAASAGRGGRK